MKHTKLSNMMGMRMKPIRSYRRIILDEDLEKAKKYMRGLILDVGGGHKRGFFKIPEGARWLVLDSKKEFSPDILADAQDLPIKSENIDVIKCTEVLEYIENPDRIIKEFYRILKPSGILILSVPFNFGIHYDLYDFQRFTHYKLRRMLEGDFNIITLKEQGLYFTVLCYMVKQNILNTKSRIRWLFYWTFPILDALVKLDNFDFVKNSKFMSSFTTGYFVVAVKR